MKKHIIIVVAVLLLFWGALHAQDSGFGLGIVVGEPTGLSGKLWTGSTTAFAGAAAWSLRGDEALHLHLDYLLHNYDVIKVENGKLPVYYGMGGRIRLEEGGDTRIGLRIPVGLNYQFASAPLDLFFELVPILDLLPDTEFQVNAGIGIRYFFLHRKS